MAVDTQYGEAIWLDGVFHDPKEANTSVMSHAIHYGSGFFEGIRAYATPDGPAIFQLTEHIERLFRSCAFYHVTIPYTVEELVQATIDLVAKNGFESCYIRPFVFLGTPWQALMAKDTTVHVGISCWELGEYFDKGAGIRAKVASYRRVSSTMMPMQAKAAANYMNSQLLKGEALRDGFDEAIALDMNGNVSEASVANLFMLKNGTIYTPSLDCSVLDGITRQVIMRLAQDQGYPVVERHIGRDELYVADEIFLTGTAAEITSVGEIDHIIINGGTRAVADELLDLYRQAVSGQLPQYASWLTYVTPAIAE
ncbi:branched-chain amino acid transaminase [Exiguobacterium sp. RIT594]|uniref:branched-chain amino acid transaminase n=1 Tax=Exiguobacterium sp. RIT594 TaxID=2282449 RepID=UPI000DF72D87|nr:branched-chain amino acid transaminase [Exiguobacterium sp. RIT594]RDB32775.1 branched-chain amino acid transaminase [Exiguobacterium sp. RIT594]